mgnify:CR=1 FL=1
MTYDPSVNPRESKKHYISATEEDITGMLDALGLEKLEDLYSHIADDVKFDGDIAIAPAKSANQIIEELSAMAAKNNVKPSFQGGGLKAYKIPDITNIVLGIRELTTSYTPYQPERSQGTLTTHWIYQSLISQLTGFEAVNASMYDRATTLFEALKCSQKIQKKKNTVLLLPSLFPNDIEVQLTQCKNTKLNVVVLDDPTFAETGVISVDAVAAKIEEIGSDLASIAIPQINSVGSLENVNALTDLAHANKALAIAIVDPILLATGGLVPPAQWGEAGADIFVAEGQHLAIAPNYGGPGLGIFGIRYNKKTAKHIRATAGRFIGDAKDEAGRDCKVIVLSTREQHIKREKANSNICSNEAYIATVAGAAILNRGEEGMKEAATLSRVNAAAAASKLTSFDGVELAFPEAPFYNEFTLKLSVSARTVLDKAKENGIYAGLDVSARIDASTDNFLMLTFTDLQEQADFDALYATFEAVFGTATTGQELADNSSFLREDTVDIATFSTEELAKYYQDLGYQNISPDSSIYPLGSCTMKYNPYLNDYIAGLDDFQNTHPESDEADVQGNLEMIYQTQEYFKAITGLAGVTTQPVAGAQGEFVGIKLFQAYHEARGDFGRDIILIPHSAHGTNPATATYAGFETKTVGGVKYGIVEIDALPSGEKDHDQLKALVEEYGDRICGIMVTNPNTCGVFETNFKDMARLIHSVGGLVYMDGANMNAVAGWIDLGKLGVDAVHNNTHKTWSIPHGGGGPGDAFVAVSDKLLDFLPGIQVDKDEQGTFSMRKTDKSIGSIHRHHGNFAHKVRCYTYLQALGCDGVKRMAAIAVLCSRYLFKRLSSAYTVLPAGNTIDKVMHEFILTLSPEQFAKAEEAGTPKSLIISRVGKLFLDFGFHAPTVAFPEIFGLMVEPTESYTKDELDRFADACLEILNLVDTNPEVLQTVPHFTPIDRVDDVTANKKPVLSEKLTTLPVIIPNRVEPHVLAQMPIAEIKQLILNAHAEKLALV